MCVCMMTRSRGVIGVLGRRSDALREVMCLVRVVTATKDDGFLPAMAMVPS